MVRSAVKPVRPRTQSVCERLSNRLDDLARHEGLDSNDEMTRLLLKFMFDDDGEIKNSNGTPTNPIRPNPAESDP
jgi:hypothetical protein